MSPEVFELVCGMDMKKTETRLALQCAPLIAGIKSSNLLRVPESEEYALEMILKNTDISFYRFLRKNGTSIFLLFREHELSGILKMGGARKLLKELGYYEWELWAVLRQFQKRYQLCIEGKTAFPHEIGVLLGYPLEDVRGFILHGGADSLYSGYWKVYANVPEKQKLFRAFEAAREKLVQWIADGGEIQEAIRRGSYLYACRKWHKNEASHQGIYCI